MHYTNPVIKGFYPDPSICEANGKFYLACSSFQYFPGVPLFESTDLVNWTQIGHALTRKSQVMLEKVDSSGGVFAPTLRFHDGRFYMVTNNNTTKENFYIYTDNIYGEWSDPITVDQDGIDPSLLFDGGHVYFISNGLDENGVYCVIQCEIDIKNGHKLTPGRPIWYGSGGRYLESPHMYHIGKYYYLVAAEGGTEYGHMVTYARAVTPWGPFINYPHNPVLTNRNKAPQIIQGIGHGDLICNAHGDWFILSLGFRQIHKWHPYHHLGREVFLTPASFDEDGWFRAGIDGTTDFSYEIRGDFCQTYKALYTFENTTWNLDWAYLRHPQLHNYDLEKNLLTLHGTDITLDDVDCPTFIGLRQKDFRMTVSVRVTYLAAIDHIPHHTEEDPCRSTQAHPLSGSTLCDSVLSDSALCDSALSGSALSDSALCDSALSGSALSSSALCDSALSGSDSATVTCEAGLTLYMDELHHYDIYISKSGSRYTAILELNIGGIKHTQTSIPLAGGQATLLVEAGNLEYHFYLVGGEEQKEQVHLQDSLCGLRNSEQVSLPGEKILLGSAYTKYLSSEVAGGFTGVMIGLYAVGVSARFRDFSCAYHAQQD